MAGTVAGFDPDAFRTNIRNTMTMGLPDDQSLQPTFLFRSVNSYAEGTLLDVVGRPIDPRVRPTVTTPVGVRVPCAVEYALDATNNEGLAGTFFADRAVITVLDVDYTLIQDAIEVDLNGRRYIIQQMLSFGLGTVTIYQLQCYRKGTD